MSTRTPTLNRRQRPSCYKPQRSLAEDALLTSAMAQVLDYYETGELVGAYEAAKRQNDAKPGPQMRDVGVHIEAYAYDRSNRDASRDERGHRRND